MSVSHQNLTGFTGRSKEVYIQTFRIMDPHYTRAEKKRKVLGSDLNIHRLHDLYNDEYYRAGEIPIRALVYTDKYLVMNSVYRVMSPQNNNLPKIFLTYRSEMCYISGFVLLRIIWVMTYHFRLICCLALYIYIYICRKFDFFRYFSQVQYLKNHAFKSLMFM